MKVTLIDWAEVISLVIFKFFPTTPPSAFPFLWLFFYSFVFQDEATLTEWSFIDGHLPHVLPVLSHYVRCEIKSLNNWSLLTNVINETKHD